MLLKDNPLKVMGLFFDYPEKNFHIRQMARLTRLSAPGVLKIIFKLKKRGLLISKSNGLVENVYATRNPVFLRLKTAYNMLNLEESGLIKSLKDTYEEPEAIVLFGSFSKGEDSSESDVDIAVVTGKHAELSLKLFEKRVKRRINIHEIKLNECTSEFKNNLANGVVLSGYLQLL